MPTSQLGAAIRSCSMGTCFDTIGRVPGAGGEFRVGTDRRELYGQHDGDGTAALCATRRGDDGTVVLSGRCGDHGDGATAGGTPIATYTFADGGLDGWLRSGQATLSNAAPPVLDPNGDQRALLTTNRTAGRRGPSLQSAERAERGGRCDVSGECLRVACGSRQR
jgi:endo-1,4-beta-xylanase